VSIKAFAVTFFVSGLAAALIVQAIVGHYEKLKPDVAVKVGDVILSTSSTPRVVTGYILKPEDTKYGPTFSRRLGDKESGDKNYRTDNKETPSQEAPPTRKKDKKGLTSAGEYKNTSGLEDNELLNPYVIERIMKANPRTYFFHGEAKSQKSAASEGVKVALISLTPRKDDYFLKFKITNSSKDYFIPEGFAVRAGERNWQEIDRFFPKNILQSGDEITGYLRVKGKKEDVNLFIVNESGGLARKFSIFY